MGLLLVIAEVLLLPSSLRLVSAHCPGAGLLTPLRHELSHSYAVRTAVPPPLTNAETRKTSRSEEHTSELQSRQYLVCRLLLEKKKLTLLTAPTCCPARSGCTALPQPGSRSAPV